MAATITFCRRNTEFSPNYRSQLVKFKFFYSTSLFPPNLKHEFSARPATAATDTQFQNKKAKKPKQARTVAELINTKPWSARLEARLSSLTPLSQTSFFQTFRRIQAPLKALKFFNWAQDSGFTHNHQSYFMMLDILGKARYLNPARNFLLSIPKKSNFTVALTDKFFNSLIRSYGDAGLFQESIKVFKVMKSMGISPSTITFNSLFTILFKRGKVGMVYELYNEMLRTYGVKPDLYTFSILIRGFCKNSMVDEAFRTFKEMADFHCQPDLVTYTTIVDGLCRAGKVSIARNVVNGMRKKADCLKPNVVTYTILIRGYCEKGEIDEALDVFREMVGDGIKPNDITFNTMIKGLCEAQKFDMVKEVLSERQGEGGGFVPDTCTFNTMMYAHCSMGNLAEALRGFEKMKELKIDRDSATYSTLIRAFCQEESFKKAEELLDELVAEEILLQDGNCTPIVAAYNPIFEYLCSNGKTKKAEGLFRQLMKRGKQDAAAFETLISGHCREGTFLNGYKLLILMLRRYFKPHIKIYESLIAGLVKIGEASLAQDALEKMLRSLYLPRTSLFHCVLTSLIEKGRARESANLMTLMLEKEIRPNIHLSTDAVQLLLKSGSRNRAFQLVGSLYQNGYVVNVGELIPSLCWEGKALEAGEILVVGLKNDQHIDVGLCDTVLSSLCKCGKLAEAFKVFYEWLEKGNKQALGCLGDLKSGLEASGKIKEAEFVSKRMLNS